MRGTRNVGLVLVLGGLVGCAARHAEITYPLDDVPRLGGGPLSQLTLVVEPFADGRSEAAQQRRVDGALSPAVVEQGGDDWHANSDDAYDETSVPMGVAEAVVEHLRATQMFRSVQVGSAATPGDLHLSGTLRRFDALQDRQVGTRAVVAQGGLLPLLVGANTATRYGADVTIENVRLFRPDGGALLWQGTLDGSFTGTSTVLASNDLQVSEHANIALKQAVGKMLDQLARLRATDVATSARPPAAVGSPP